MSSDKNVPESDEASKTAEVDTLQAAMEAAAESVEEETSAPAAEPDADTDVSPAPHEAVTEAIIQAKNELEEVLEQTRKEAENFQKKWLRAAADLENYKKRAIREREENTKFANERLLKDFLPILDDMERALDASQQIEDKKKAAEQIFDGVKLVLKKLLTQLEKHGVETFESEGEPFDPTFHEAVQQIHAEVDAGKVVQQLQRGFKLNERLLRPAMVVISLGPESK